MNKRLKVYRLQMIWNKHYRNKKILKIPDDNLSKSLRIYMRMGIVYQPKWEWWFAAKTNDDFEYGGSDNLDEVAWHFKNGHLQSGGRSKPMVWTL